MRAFINEIQKSSLVINSRNEIHHRNELLLSYKSLNYIPLYGHIIYVHEEVNRLTADIKLLIWISFSLKGSQSQVASL